MRKYVSGSRWALWRWTETDSGYLTRLHFWKTPWFAIDIHWINAPDPEPYLHDHPVTFFSIILRGGYLEIRKKGDQPHFKLVWHRWFNFIRASVEDRHRIIAVKAKTITICLMGPKTREWGFHVPKTYRKLWDDHTWVHWKAYYALQKEGWIE